MHTLSKTAGFLLVLVASAVPSYSQEASADQAVAAKADTQITDPSGRFVDEFGSSFEFTLCGESGTNLCAVLSNLEGNSATDENLAFVGKQVIQAEQTAPNEWKGVIAAGGMSADATITQTGPNTIEVQGCRAAVLCQTLAYTRA
jgi:hypothetical protein